MSQKFEKTVMINRCNYDLEFGFPAVVAIEKQLDRSIFAIIRQLGFREISAIFWGLFQTNHGAVSIEESDKLVDHFGYDNVLTLVAEAIQSYFPAATVSKDSKVAKPKNAAKSKAA